jgi:hypothetical protein
MGHSLALAKIDQIVLTTSWETAIPEEMIKTPIQEKQTQNRNLNFVDPTVVARSLSGGKINFVINGISTEDFAMDIFSVAGSRIWSYQQKGATAPDYQVVWDGTDGQLKPVKSGVYVAKIKTENSSKQLLVLLNR